jgi:aspartyl-tRNA(Asn)/glutamyl-tRNA(Gln) amidotransferase subunit A
MNPRPTLTSMASDLAARRVSAMELAQTAIARAEQSRALLNAIVTMDPERTAQEARAADARLAAGEATALTGIPLVHKDVFCAQGWRCSAGSRMLKDFVSPYDATVVARLKDAGAVTIGRANMDEFAMGSSNENSFFGPVRNPWDTRLVPGGSSGGSAAAVAAGIVPAATGTDTGGSIRQPASFCGVSGIKPTYGRVSRFGMIAFASSLDQAGVMAHTAADLALLLSAIAGFDPHDSTSLEKPDEDFGRSLQTPLAGKRIGVPREYFAEGLDQSVAQVVQAALAELTRAGAQLVDVSLPNMHLAVPAYYVIAPAEASSNLSRFDGVRYGYRASDVRNLDDLYARSRSEGFGPEVRRRILIGTYVLSHGYYDDYYVKAQRVRRLIADDFAKAFERCDLIAGPVAPTAAYALGACTQDPVAMYLGDLYTIPASLAGLPGMSIPCGFTADHKPVGLQLIGPYFSEAALLGFAHQYQNITDWHEQLSPYAKAAKVGQP